MIEQYHTCLGPLDDKQIEQFSDGKWKDKLLVTNDLKVYLKFCPIPFTKIIYCENCNNLLVEKGSYQQVAEKATAKGWLCIDRNIAEESPDDTDMAGKCFCPACLEGI